MRGDAGRVLEVLLNDLDQEDDEKDGADGGQHGPHDARHERRGQHDAAVAVPRRPAPKVVEHVPRRCHLLRHSPSVDPAKLRPRSLVRKFRST